MIIGDSHNFGQATRLTNYGGQTAVFKPRTVFWETLFFASSSPLSPLLGTQSACRNQQPAGNFFQLQCLSAEANSGVMALSQASSSKVQDSFYDFGQLLAYAFIFGIQDLHRENVLETADGFQPVDAEVVLSRLQLPDQTYLLSRRTNPSSHCLLSSFTSDPNNLPIQSFSRLAAGFIQMLDLIKLNLDAILQILQSSISQAQKSPPIRVLIRPTKVYRHSLLSNDLPDDFLPAEKIQLLRGDIPYFFKFLNSSRLHYWISENAIGDVDLSDATRSIFLSTGVDPTELLKIDRIDYELVPNGLLYLARQHLSPSWTGTLELGSTNLEVTETKISVLRSAHRFLANKPKHSPH